MKNCPIIVLSHQDKLHRTKKFISHIGNKTNITKKSKNIGLLHTNQGYSRCCGTDYTCVLRIASPVRLDFAVMQVGLVKKQI